jgi:arginyl-tRNA synthetase
MVAYVVDKRQELHFIQVFRCAKKTGIVPESTDLEFVGFGTMNGSDCKPFKTRDGGVMRLSSLLDEITSGMKDKIRSGGVLDGEEADRVAAQVALSAIKYGDLSNQCAKDYVFDVDRFTSFEGNTGPYILYTMVRIKSILSKFESEGGKLESVSVLSPETESERNLMLCISRFQDAVKAAAEELAPHKICAFIYDLSNALNHFYHETRILAEENTEKKLGYLSLLSVTLKVLETSIDMLGFDAPDRM